MIVDGYYITSLDQLMTFNSANELEFIMDELQDSTISNTQENNDITGKNGAVVGTLKRNKAVTVSGNNGLIVAGAIAAQTGSTVESGKFTIRTTDILTVESNSVTLTNTPVGAAGAEIITVRKKGSNGLLGEAFEQDATASASGKFAYADGTITFFEGDLEDGDVVTVFYDTEVDNATRVTNDADTYSKTLKAYLDVTVQDRCDKLLHGQFIFPRADFTGNFDMSLGGTDSVQSYEFRTLKNLCSNEVGKGLFWEFICWE